MRRFTELFTAIDRTTRTSEKLAALERYFRETPPHDASWGLFFLSGGKLKRLVGSSTLHQAIEDASGLPDWLIGESYEATGDFAETLALLLPEHNAEAAGNGAQSLALHQLVERRMLALKALLEPAQRELITRTWRELPCAERFIFNKLITGNFRVGVARTLIIKPLAAAAGTSPAIMAHRFSGQWEPSAERYSQLIEGKASADAPTQPYPFLLGYPLDSAPHELGDPSHWQAEWKYDGLRAQIVRRPDRLFIWSRGDELITAAFPEVTQAANGLTANVVLDGEMVAWENDRPLPFALLQRRMNRKAVEATLFPDIPVAFVAFDLLEADGVDLREQPLVERRRLLEHIIASLGRGAITIAPILPFSIWDDIARLRTQSRERHVEGVMLKRLDGLYRVGRKRGDWWKWKIDPYTIDAVLIYAQDGSGRRSGLFTDYTFGLWNESPDVADRQLVPVAKAYSGLTDEEIRQVDRFIRGNTTERRGPVRVVKPELVFELAFEGIQESDRHKAGLAVRFPRMSRWRQDKRPDEADSLETLRAIHRAAMSNHDTR